MYKVYLELTIKDTTPESAKKTARGLVMYITTEYTIHSTLGHNLEENMFRIFIDIPVESPTLEEAIVMGNQIMGLFLDEDRFTKDIADLGITRLNYRLGDDEDRTPKNYFIIDDKGHAASRKTKVELVSELDTDTIIDKVEEIG